MVSPHLEYCLHTLTFLLVRDISELDKVYEVSARYLPRMRNLSYLETLDRLKLFFSSTDEAVASSNRNLLNPKRFYEC